LHRPIIGQPTLILTENDINTVIRGGKVILQWTEELNPSRLVS